MIREILRKIGLDSIEDIVGEELRQVKLKVLEEERTVLLRIIGGLEERLAKLGGAVRTAKRAAARKPAKAPGKGASRFRKPGESLKEMAVKALEAAKKPLAVDDLRARVMKLGYKTAASANNLRVSFFKVLADTKLFKKVEAGVYRLAGAAKPPATKPAAVKKPKRTAKSKSKKTTPKTQKKPAAPKQGKPAVEKKPASTKPAVQPAAQPATDHPVTAPTEKK